MSRRAEKGVIAPRADPAHLLLAGEPQPRPSRLLTTTPPNNKPQRSQTLCDYTETLNPAVALATRMDGTLAGPADFLDDNSLEAQVARMRADAARLPVDHRRGTR